MRSFCLLLACWLVTAVAFAQAPLPASPPYLAAQLAPEADTVAAIHRLFAAKRTRSHIILGALAAGVLTGAIISGSENHGSSGRNSTYGGAGLSFSGTDYAVLYTIVALPFVIGDVLYHASYSKKKEARAQADFRVHHLSPHLKRQLRARYFR